LFSILTLERGRSVNNTLVQTSKKYWKESDIQLKKKKMEETVKTVYTLQN